MLVALSQRDELFFSAGAVTIGTGSGAGAVLAPAHGGNRQLTLTIQGSLTYNSDATYTYTFKAKRNRSKIDKVVANGVTINSGAMINLSGTTQGRLTQGTMLHPDQEHRRYPDCGHLQQPPRWRDREPERQQPPGRLQRRRRERSHPHGRAVNQVP